MSILMALELYYFQELLNWWHSPFKFEYWINSFFETVKLTISQITSATCDENKIEKCGNAIKRPGHDMWIS